MAQSKRTISLLSDAEQDAIYAEPNFNEVERALYFDFSDDELSVVNRYRTTKAKISFLLMLGYFKAKQQLYLGPTHEKLF